MQSTRTPAPKSSKSSKRLADRTVPEQQDSAKSDVAMSEAEKREVMIRIAAYSFYERRGFVGGHELEDWLQAEMEVDRQLAATPKPTARK